MECPSCQTPASQDARFCTACGAALRVEGGVDAADLDATPDGSGDERPASADVGPDATQAVPPPQDAATRAQPPVADATSRVDQVDATGRLPAVPASVTPAQDPPQATGSSLRSCPACGSPNAAQRLLCGRCGADLETGRLAAPAAELHQPGDAVDVVGEVDVRERPRRSRTALVVAAIVLGGAALGALVGVLVVRGGAEPEPAAPVFDPAVYPGEPQELTITGVGASSTRPAAGDVEYGADNLVDGDPTTAWSHDPTVEEAQDIDLALVPETPSWITALVIANGAQADDLSFAADGRVLRMAVLVDGEPAVELQLLDQAGYVQVTLPTPLLLDEVRLVVLEAVAGDTYEEVSVSEIGLVGHPAVGQDLVDATEEG